MIITSLMKCSQDGERREISEKLDERFQWLEVDLVEKSQFLNKRIA